MTKVKIPKKVGGVKIPKKARKKANKALKMADSPAVREFAAAAVGAARQAKWIKSEVRGNGRSFGASFDIDIDGDRLAQAIRTAALNGINSFLQGLEEGLRNADDERSAEPPESPEPPEPPPPPEPPVPPKAPRPPRPPRPRL